MFTQLLALFGFMAFVFLHVWVLYIYNKYAPKTVLSLPTSSGGDDEKNTKQKHEIARLRRVDQQRRLKIIASPGIAVLLYILIGFVVYLFAGLEVTVAIATLLAVFTIVFFGSLFTLLLRPDLVKHLTNDPNRNRPPSTPEFTDDPAISYPPSTFGLFTNLGAGQGKWIMSGGRPIRPLLHYTGYMLLGDRPDNDLKITNRAYSEVVPAKWTDNLGIQHEGSSHPVPFPVKKAGLLWLLYSPWSILWWFWKLKIYTVLGVVFTGIYPWRFILVSPLEHFRQASVGGEITARRRYNYSDHFRASEARKWSE